MRTRGQSIAADTGVHPRRRSSGYGGRSLPSFSLGQSRCNCGISRRVPAPSRGRCAGRARLRDPGRNALRRAAARERGDRYVEAPLVGTDVDLVVSGPTARARVSQIFHNPTDGWVEAVYVYPLPEGGAVDTLKMVIGERIVVGDIKERRRPARSTSRRVPPAGRPP